jgi:hypothetical protein
MINMKQLKERLDAARKKFGRPFVHEPGSDWKPNKEPFLTRYFNEQRLKGSKS